MFTILKFSPYLHNFYSQCDPGTHCTLYAFLMDYIKDVFLGQIHADNGDALNSASLSLGKNNCINCKMCIKYQSRTIKLFQIVHCKYVTSNEIKPQFKEMFIKPFV